MSKLPKRERDLLQDIAWGTEHFGSLVTRAKVTAGRLVAKKLARSVGQVLVVDGDGFAVQPERWRHGWTITEKGKRWLARAGA